jgi:hypothetical protein
MKTWITRTLAALAAALALASTPWLTPALATGASDTSESNILTHNFRTGSWTKPTVIAVALIRATRGTWAASTAYASNDTAIPTTANGRIYRQTVASCTSAASEPTWPTTAGGTVSDNTCSWTEQTVQLEACNFTEVANAGAYARPTANPLDANWAAPSAGAGTGTGETSNSVAINYATPSANWAGTVWGFYLMDSATYGAGNCMWYGALTTPKVINSGDTVSFAVGALKVQVDN